MSSLNLLDRTFSNESEHYNSFYEELPKNFMLTNTGGLTPREYDVKMAVLRGILISALNEIKSGFLYKIEHLISGDFFKSVNEQADELLKNHHKDPAAVLFRVIIEKTLKDLCDREGIVYVPKDKASSLNLTSPVSL